MADECKACGGEIEDPDDALWNMSGLEPLEDEDTFEPVFEDGPYCSFDCSLEVDDA